MPKGMKQAGTKHPYGVSGRKRGGSMVDRVYHGETRADSAGSYKGSRSTKSGKKGKMSY